LSERHNQHLAQPAAANAAHRARRASGGYPGRARWPFMSTWPFTSTMTALLTAGVLLAPASAQTPATTPTTSEKLDALKQHDRELQSVRTQQQKSADTEAALKREIETIGADRRKLNQSLIDTASRIRALEDKITATETRLKPLDADRDKIKASLESRRAVIADVLAALQRMGLHPPPALLVTPEDALQAVRSAILLGAVLPDMKAQAQALADDLGRLVKLRKDIAGERDRLKGEAAAIENERTRMAALIGERQKQQADREASLAAERARAVDLARQAHSLQDLIAKLEQGLDEQTRTEREAALPAPSPGGSILNDPGRMKPAVTFASLRGKVPIPVNGIKIRSFGDPDGVGGTEKGLSIATRAGAQVTAPADSWVVYAGPFRSYGQLLILNAGAGYHILLAGMERISVDLGQFVLAGEPVAAMGNGSHIAAILATGSSQPVLYIELRKDGAPIDPGPWWAAGEVEKVRG
jgi:septal ring factor EnvC (AmiA/AmiB activator)